MRKTPRFHLLIVLTVLLTAWWTANACTNFAASYDGMVLFGNSEDGGISHPLGEGPDTAVVWFCPPVSETLGTGYGCIVLGWFWQGTRISFQGGTNDQGLSFDSTGIPEVALNPHPERPFRPEREYFWGKLLRQCATVDDAIALAFQYDWEHMWFQLFVSDATGAAAIIGPGLDGELFVERKETEDGYLAQTNFNRLYPESHYNRYPCPRYEAAVQILDLAVDRGEVTLEVFTDVLKAVQGTGPFAYTPYSNIVDPVNRVITVVYAGQYEDPIVLHLDTELANGERWAYLSDLVSEDTRIAGQAVYTRFRTRQRLVLTTAIAGLLAAGVLLLSWIF